MNKNPEVDAFLKEKKPLFLNEINHIRKLILQIDERISETIKWSAPTFVYKGNIATFNLRTKNFVNLTFHEGSIIKDPYHILEGNGKKAKVIRFKNLEDIECKTEALQTVFKNWIKLKG